MNIPYYAYNNTTKVIEKTGTIDPDLLADHQAQLAEHTMVISDAETIRKLHAAPALTHFAHDDEKGPRLLPEEQRPKEIELDQPVTTSLDEIAEKLDLLLKFFTEDFPKVMVNAIREAMEP